MHHSLFFYQSISAINKHVLTLHFQPTPEAVQKAVTIIILICILRCALYAVYLDCSRISAHFVSSIVSGSCLEGGLS